MSMSLNKNISIKQHTVMVYEYIYKKKNTVEAGYKNIGYNVKPLIITKWQSPKLMTLIIVIKNMYCF